ncbi:MULTISPECIES: hypothetical protein [unclassified Spirosoma]|uniref:hypothetical protein n=1 Tax=unclassified Spirosoma TaxID=2621999 RepID=UPI0025E546CD|nr:MULTISPECIES: hypothetical protein [unclassified Spirosoma]
MRTKLIVLFALVGLMACQPDDKLTGVAAGAAGRYIVTAYIDGGDTLFSLVPGSTGYKPGINKLDISNFTVELTITDSDQLALTTAYWRNGIQSTVSKAVRVQLGNSDYRFSLSDTSTIPFYEGRVSRFSGLFYERMVGGGFRIPLAGSSPPSPSPSQDIIIIAQPGR